MELLQTLKTSACFSPTNSNNIPPASEQLMSVRHSLEQARIHRKNLLMICSLSVHELVEKYQDVMLVDESMSELHNLLAILENVLRHRLKSRKCWFGYEESLYYWDYVKEISENIGNGNSSIVLTENLGYKSSRAKGRAWIRMALVEKRLHTYLYETKKYRQITKFYYAKGAFMLSAELGTLAKLVEQLKNVDFNLCLRDSDLEIGEYHTIDYTPYLKQLRNDNLVLEDDISDDSSQHLWSRSGTATTLLLNATPVTTAANCDEDEYESGIGAEEQQQAPLIFSTNAMMDKEENPWKYLFYKMEEMYKKAACQKKKMEQLLDERDKKMEVIIKHNDILSSALKNLGFQNTIESKQIDGVINGLENLLTEIENKKVEMARDCSPRSIFKFDYEQHQSSHHFEDLRLQQNCFEDEFVTKEEERTNDTKIPLYILNKNKHGFESNFALNNFEKTHRISSLNDILDQNLVQNFRSTFANLHDGKLSNFGNNSMVKSHTYGTDLTLYDLVNENFRLRSVASSETTDSNSGEEAKDEMWLGDRKVGSDITKSISCHMMASFIKQRLKDVDYLYQSRELDH